MNQVLENAYFSNVDFAIAYKKIIWDTNHEVANIQVIRINPAFEKLFGVLRKDFENCFLFETWSASKNWAELYKPSLLKNKHLESEVFSKDLDKWLRISINLLEDDYIMVSFFDITEEKLMLERMLEDSLGFLSMYQNESIHQQITDFVRIVSGAEYSALNIFEEDKSSFRTVALSGVSQHLKKISEILGFPLINKMWERDDAKTKKLKNLDIFRFKNLSDLAGNVLPSKIVRLIETTFNFKDVYVLRIYKDDISIGDFTLFFKKGSLLKNEAFLILYARIVAMIMERNKTFYKLQESNTRFGEVALQSKEIIWETNENGQFTYVNTVCSEILGYSPEEIIAKKHFFELIGNASSQKVIEGITEKYKNHQNISELELVIKTKDGLLKTFIANARAVFSSNNSFTGYRGAFHDISLEKTSLYELIRLEHAVEQSPASVVITDIDANIVYVNKKFTQITGYSFAEAKGKNPRILRASRDNDELYIDLWKHLNSGVSWSGEFINKRKNGEIFFELATITPVKDESGKVINFIAIKEDITEKKQIEEDLENSRKQIETIYNSIPVLVLIVNQKGEVKYYNSHFLKTSTLTEKELINTNICNIFESTESALDFNNWNNCLLKKNIDKTFAEETSQTDVEYHILNKNKLSQTESYFIGNTVLIDFQNQKHVMVCLSDISLQKQNEKRLAYQLELQHLVTDAANIMVKATKETINPSVQLILEQTSRFFKNDRAYIYLYDDKEKCFKYSNGWADENCSLAFKEKRFKKGNYFSKWEKMFRTNKWLGFENINELSGLKQNQLDLIKEMDIVSLLCFPLINENQIAGFLSFDTVSKTKVWSTDYISTLEVITELIAKNLFKHYAEESFRISQERFNLLISANNDGIWDLTIPTNELFWSPRWKEIVGYQDHELVCSDEVFKSLIHPDDLSYVVEHLDGYISGENPEYRVEYRMKHKKGHDVWIYSRGELLRDASGNPYRIAGSHTDITHRKNQEKAIIHKQQLLSAIVDSTDELLRNANYVDALQKVMNILGQTTKADRVYLFQLKDKQYFKIVDWFSPSYQIGNFFDFSDLSFKETEEFIDQIIENKSFFASDLFQLSDSPVKKSLESQNVLSILIFPLFVEEQFWGFVGFNDATAHHKWTDDEFSILNSFSGTLSKSIERAMLQERLSISLEKAKEASKAKSDFLSTVSHEIRTPLNGVIGFVDLMKRTELNPSQQQYMESVSLSANTLLDLINDVLDFSKIEAGKLILNPEETSLIELLEQIVEMIQFSAHQKNLEIILKISHNYPEFVWVDSMRIRQVLINLLSNAIKFTNTGEVELGMEVDSQTESNASIKFWVKDTGIGIHQEKISSILESFTQGDASVTRKYGGSGLGLAIATKILNIMDSKLEVKSTPGIGSIFSFTLNLPVRKRKKTKKPSTDLIKKVLIVDDNKQNRIVLKEMLKSYNISSDSCSSGSETLKKLQESRDFDLLIIDYHMPEMDGLSLIENIRNNYSEFGSKVSIMLLHSSYDDKFITDKSKKLKIDAHYLKPMKLSQLSSFIQKTQTKSVPKVIKTPEIDNELKHVFEKPFKILIAEDNPTNMLLVKKMLSLIIPNSVLIEAKNGFVAIDILSKADVDMVFMDIHMPEMSGTDAAKYIREELKNQKLPIIALTADTSKDEKEKCFEIGMNDYLSKPVVISDIKNIIIKYLA